MIFLRHVQIMAPDTRQWICTVKLQDARIRLSAGCVGSAHDSVESGKCEMHATTSTAQLIG